MLKSLGWEAAPQVAGIFKTCKGHRDVNRCPALCCCPAPSRVSICHGVIATESQNALGWKGPLAQPPCSEQGHLQPDQVAQSPVQPGLQCVQGWGIDHLSGQLVADNNSATIVREKSLPLSLLVLLPCFRGLLRCLSQMDPACSPQRCSPTLITRPGCPAMSPPSLLRIHTRS